MKESEVFWQTWQWKPLLYGSQGQGSSHWSQQHVTRVLGSGGSEVPAKEVSLWSWCFFWLLIPDYLVSKLSSLGLLEILY